MRMNRLKMLKSELKGFDMFNRVYANRDDMIGFDCARNTWLYAGISGEEIFIDKFYGSSEPALSIKQARKLANKLLKFCDKIEKI